MVICHIHHQTCASCACLHARFLFIASALILKLAFIFMIPKYVFSGLAPVSGEDVIPLEYVVMSLPSRIPLGPEYPLLKILEKYIVLFFQLVCILRDICILLRVDIEALGISRESDWWDNGPTVLSVVYIVPIDPAEERVLFHTLCASTYVT